MNLSTTNYGDWIPNTIKSGSLKLKALEDRLIVSWDYIPKENFYGSVEFHYSITKTVDNSTVVIESGVTKETQFTHLFVRNAESGNEFPEASDIRSYTVSIYAQNTERNDIDENKSAAYSTVIYDFSEYGTWSIPNITTDNLTKEVVDRTLIMKFVPPTPSGKKLLGNTRWRIQIKRIGVVTRESSSGYPEVTPDTEWLKPNLFANPLESETAYRYESSETGYDGYVESDGVFSQTLPLAGQSNSNIVDTIYYYAVQAYNEAGESNWLGKTSGAELTVIAKCTSISDIVKANADYKQLYVERLSAISENVGLISQGGFGDFRASAGDNHWALSDLSAEESGVEGGVKKGDFSVGDTNEYVKVEPYDVTVNGETVRRYSVRIKSCSFELESSASTFTGQTIVYDDTDKTKRAILSAFGVTIESLDSVTDTWNRVGIFRAETTGLGKTITSIGSGTANFKFGNFILNGEKLYSFTSDELDQDGENSADIVTDGSVEALSTPVGESCFNGSVTVPTQQSLKNVMFRNKGAVVIPNSDNVYVDGVLYDGKAKVANDNASTDWGLTQAQIQSRLFHSVIGD